MMYFKFSQLECSFHVGNCFLGMFIRVFRAPDRASGELWLWEAQKWTFSCRKLQSRERRRSVPHFSSLPLAVALAWLVVSHPEYEYHPPLHLPVLTTPVL